MTTDVVSLSDWQLQQHLFDSIQQIFNAVRYVETPDTFYVIETPDEITGPGRYYGPRHKSLKETGDAIAGLPPGARPYAHIIQGYDRNGRRNGYFIWVEQGKSRKETYRTHRGGKPGRVYT